VNSSSSPWMMPISSAGIPELLLDQALQGAPVLRGIEVVEEDGLAQLLGVVEGQVGRGHIEPSATALCPRGAAVIELDPLLDVAAEQVAGETNRRKVG